MKKEQKKVKKPEMSLGEMRRGSAALTIGVIGLVILALITLYIAIAMSQDMTADAWGFSGFAALYIICPFLPFCLFLAGAMLICSVRASRFYKKDLRVVGVMLLMGLGFAILGTILWRAMIFAWLIYYGLLFWWLTRRFMKRADYFAEVEGK